jgi:hypothetical protein
VDLSDLLTSYSARSKATRGNNAERWASISRKTCRPVSAESRPKAASFNASCHGQALYAVDDEALSKKRDDLIEKNQFSEATRMLAEKAKGLFTGGDQSWRFRAPEEAASYLVHIQAAKWKIIPESEMQVDRCNDVSADVAESGRILSCALFTRDGLQMFGVSLLKYTGGRNRT